MSTYRPFSSSRLRRTEPARHLAGFCCAISLLLTGGSTFAGAATVYTIDSDQQVEVQMAGGDINTNTSSFFCPPGYMISPLRVNHGWHHLGYNPHYVNGLQFGCSGLNPDGTMETHYFMQDEIGYPDHFGNDNGTYNWVDCWSDLMTGILGRSGQWIDKFGALCGDIDDIMLGNHDPNMTEGPYGGEGGSPFERQCPAGYVPTGAHISRTNNGHYIDGVQLVCSRVTTVSSTSYDFGYGVGRTAAQMCGNSDLQECLIGDKFLPVSARTMHNTAHYDSWKDFFRGPRFYPDFKCRGDQGDLVDCVDGNGNVKESLLIDTLNHDDGHDWDPDENYAVVSCDNIDCDPDTLYIRSPYHHHWLLNYDTAWVYEGNDYCAEYATQSKHWNLWKSANCSVGHAAIVPFRKRDLEDVWPLILLNSTSAEGTHPEPFVIFSCLREQDMTGIVSAASDGTAPVPDQGGYSCHIDKDTMTAIAKQFSSFGDRFDNLESEAIFAIGQTIAIEVLSAGTGWLLKSAAEIAELSEAAQTAARAIGRWSVHTGIDGYFLVSGVMEMAECGNDVACKEVALVQIGMAMLSMKKAALETPEMMGNIMTILQESGSPALADEIAPFLNGVEEGFEETSGRQIDNGSSSTPEEPQAVTPESEPPPSEAVGVCPIA